MPTSRTVFLIHMPTSRTVFLIILAGILLASCGCGSSATQPLDMGGPDANQIAALIEELNDARGNPKRMAGILAAQTKIDQPERFKRCEFTIVGRPKVSGTEGRCKVLVVLMPEGTPLGEAEWTFVKENDQWKLAAAPLP